MKKIRAESSKSKIHKQSYKNSLLKLREIMSYFFKSQANNKKLWTSFNKEKLNLRVKWINRKKNLLRLTRKYQIKNQFRH